MDKRMLFGMLLCAPFLLKGQNFRWESKIEPVTATGYHKILFTPEVTSQLREGYPDVRIYDKEGYETPFLIFKDEARVGVDRFVTYQIVNKSYQPGNSFIVVKNTIGNPIDHIVLEVNNADAHRRMALQGSYDGGSWFAVKDEYSSVSFDTYEKGARKTTSMVRFDFPLTDYKFYRFEFDDWHYWWHWRDYAYPVFIIRAGYTEPTFIPEECIELPRPFIKQEDDKKKKQSTLQISFDEPQYIDHLEFDVQSVKGKDEDYYRAASLYERVEHKNDTVHPYEDIFIGSTILSSLNPNEINLGNRKVRNLVLKISNADDRPLSVLGVKGRQVKHYLVSKLEAGNAYVLRYGNDSLSSPVYDMKYFVDKIPKDLKVISALGRKDIYLKPVTINPIGTTKNAGIEKPGESFFKSQAFVWSAIGLVILLLGVVTVRMLGEMKEKS
jgi:hypothetical protein